MRIKKSGGKIFGADLTAAERKAMKLEIQKQLAEYTVKHRQEIDAVVLWILHVQLGLGKKRLRQFYDRFSTELDALLKRYEMEEDDKTWLCTEMLKRIDIEIGRAHV